MPWLPSTCSSRATTRSIGTAGRPCAGGSSPTCTCRPRGRSDRIEFSQVPAAPRASRETCAPPPVSSVTVAGTSPPPSSVCSAPLAAASRSAAGETSTATTRAPAATATCTAESPTPPQPCTATHSPGCTRATWTTARKAVAKRQPSAAAVAASSPSGSATRLTSAVWSATYSAIEPQCVKPGWVCQVQTWCSPAAHWAQRPHALTNGTVTRSPTRQRRTSAPTAATVPASSCPGTCGSTTSGSWPCQACQSLRQTPLAPTRTTTPPGAGSGAETSRTVSGPPKASNTSARTPAASPGPLPGLRRGHHLGRTVPRRTAACLGSRWLTRGSDKHLAGCPATSTPSEVLPGEEPAGRRPPPGKDGALARRGSSASERTRRMSDPQSWSFETRQIHAGTGPDPTTGARALPIYATTAYQFRDSQHAADLFALAEMGNIYTRIMNPTQDALEQRVASLEGGVAALAVASGQSATTLAILNIAEAGDHVVASASLYGGTYNLLHHSLPKLGVTVSFVEDPDDPQNWQALVRENTRAFFGESIGNPKGDVLDISAGADVAHRNGVPLIVDNTIATPYLLRPLESGADVVVHSATKYLGGHGTVIAGVIVDGGTFDWTGGKHPMFTTADPTYHGVVYT